ncbi:hypothetical protein N0V83_003623 [Neocucurbitaria cava]|uniref:histidine kinase n=1 Tax=Neocucurbitaria cava TaxID=798079 RepID=A0A9W8YC16_9PLEO|nr:hypothetical protein N0V83_003623 [Neocucurbitaria cava]
MAVFQNKPVEIPETPYVVANKSYFFIKDFRQIPMFAERPYVAGYPRLVSYIEVPLRSLSGHIIGSYCCVDNKTKDFSNPEALSTLGEVTAAINSYLNLKRVEGGRTRSERMVDGLSQFLGSERHVPFIGYGTTEASGLPAGPFDLEVFSQTSQMDSIPPFDRNSEPEQFPDAYDPASYSPGTENETVPPTSQQQSASKLEVLELSAQIGLLFSKVAKVIGYAMDSDGLTFYDAAATNARNPSAPLPSFNVDDLPSQPVTHEDDPPAKPLAEYRADKSAEPLMFRQPRQSLMRRLTAEYPHGHVFAVDEYGSLDDYNHQGADSTVHVNSQSAARNEWNDLFECVPKARYIMFLPLWHYQRESCFATCLVWVTSPGKTLDYGDINSLTAFGNSLMTEIFRLEAFTNTQSKSDFISSISHELRSPLHGILATVDLMQERVKEPKLVSMVDMIESCSSTLLDTFDHLLEFSKINSRASNEKSIEKNAAEHISIGIGASRALVNLESLVEDLLETVTLGHFAALNMESSLESERQDTLADGDKEDVSEPVIITTYIENDRDWVVPIDKGACIRILLNVFSNALKYTKSGYIDVTLKMLEKATGGPRSISLSVTDTGIGMSNEFLKYHLFTPFMQENSLMPGTGLGLSIVKSIVESIGGKISVDSRLHEGTRITIKVPLDTLDGELKSRTQVPLDDNSMSNDRLRGLTLGLVSIASDGSGSESRARVVPSPKVLHRSIRNIGEAKFGMVLSDDSVVAPSKVDILLIDTHALMSTDDLDLESVIRQKIPQITTNAVVTLGTPRKGTTKIFGVGKATCVTSPITAKKISAALLAALERAKCTEIIPSGSPSASASQGGLDSALPTTQDRSNVDGSSMIQEKNVNPQNNLPGQHTLSVRTKPPAIASHLEASPDQEATPAQNNSSPATDSRFKRLLLVDDNPINRKVLAAFAKRLSLPFSTANDGAEAVRLYRKAALEEANPFDCVFMDISMPVMDGFQAVTAIRQFEQQQQQTRNTYNSHSDESKSEPAFRSYILALTGLGSESARTQARSSGFDEYLLKPVRFKDVMPLLRANP